MAAPVINLTDPTTFTSAVLIGDAMGNSQVPPTLTLVGGVPVSACLELRSTLGAILIPRMTNAQQAAMTTLADGMIIYNSDAGFFQFRESNAWVNFSGGGGGGNVSGPVSSTDTAIALWNGAGGNTLRNSVVLISAGGNITEVGSIETAAGLKAFPSYSFTADIASGMWQSGVGIVDFSSNGLESLRLTASVGAVNFLAINASASTDPITLDAEGSDTNISIELTPKGTGGVIVPDGAAATPGIQFSGDLTTGIYRSGAGKIAFSSVGVLSGEVFDGGISMLGGSAGAPSYSFVDDELSGMYQNTPSLTLDFSVNGADVLTLSAVGSEVNQFLLQGSPTGSPIDITSIGTDTNISIRLIPKGTGSVVIPVGAVGTPSIAFAGDLTTGIYRPGAGIVGFSSAGTDVAGATSHGLVALAGTVTNPSYAFIADSSSGMWQTGPGVLDFSASAQLTLRLIPTITGVNYFVMAPGGTGSPITLSAFGTDTNISINLSPLGTGSVIFNNGAVGTPSIVFQGDPSTGFYEITGGSIGISSGGTLVGSVTATGFSALAGSAANPSYAFLTDATTGFYHSGAGVIGISASGSSIGTISAKGLLLGAATLATGADTITLPASATPTTPSAATVAYYTATGTGIDTNHTLGIVSVDATVGTGAKTQTSFFPIVINGTTYHLLLATA